MARPYPWPPRPGGRAYRQVAASHPPNPARWEIGPNPTGHGQVTMRVRRQPLPAGTAFARHDDGSVPTLGAAAVLARRAHRWVGGFRDPCWLRVERADRRAHAAVVAGAGTGSGATMRFQRYGHEGRADRRGRRAAGRGAVGF